MNSNPFYTIKKQEEYISTLEIDREHLINQQQNLLIPAVVITEITAIVAEMMIENIEYSKKYGLTDKAKISRNRLLKLMDITETINQISIQNNTLQLVNNRLSGLCQRLERDLSEIKRQEGLAA